MSKARIQVVEDEGIIAEDLRSSLAGMGYEVVSIVATGEEAIEKAEELRPDLVIMDVVLQGDMDGIEAANRIRARLNIPIIYLTAYSDEQTLQRAKVAEPFGYMIKPIRERELYTCIEVALFKHKMENRLRESEQWFSVTLKSIGEAVIATDRAGLVKFMNPLAESLTGRSQQEAIGSPLTEVFRVVDEKTLATCSHLVQDMITKCESVSFGDRFNLSPLEGEKGTPVETGASPIIDDKGEVVGIVVVFRDVTEKKEIDQRLRLLSAAVEQTLEGIAVVDLGGRLLFLNQAFASLHSLEREGLVGKHLSIFHTGDQLAAVDGANRVARAEGAYSGEIWHARADGSIFPGLMHTSLLRDDEGNPVGLIGTLRDITDMKRVQEALRESHEKLEAYSSSLENMVWERTRDLENSRKELKRYSESLEKTNEALKLIVEGIEERKKDVEEKIAHNLNLTVKPVVEQLKAQELPETPSFLLKSLEFNLENLFSSFGFRMAKEAHHLTPREIRICEMIRSGLSAKQMAKILGISPQTVLVHRKNIRKKLGLAKAKKNLASYLKTNL